MAKTFIEEILEKVNSNIERYHMLPQGSTVIVGFSGGADSMTLISVLNELNKRENKGWKIVGAHVHHGLRGEEADRDERHCEEACRRLGLGYEVLKADVPAMAAETGESFETCGRRVRYDFFASLAEKYSKESAMSKVRIATAHNADDGVETMLFHLARGTGLHGLTGIPPVRDDIVRPLIGTTRADIEKYCEEMDLTFVTDSTNFETEYARNRIRHNIIPELSELNGNAVENITRCIDSLREDDEFLEMLAGQLISQAAVNGVLEQVRTPADDIETSGDVVDLESYRDKVNKPKLEDSEIARRVNEARAAGENADAFSVATLVSAYPAMLHRALARIIASHMNGAAPEAVHIRAAAELLHTGTGQLQVPTGTYVRVRNGLLTFPDASRPEQVDFNYNIPLPIRESSIHLPDRTITLKVFDNPSVLPSGVLENAIDYDRINSTFIVRNRLPGDKYTPRNRNLTKTLKNLFNEAKIPAEIRDSLVIFENDGEIAFIEGFGPSENYKVKYGTKRVLAIEFIKE